MKTLCSCLAVLALSVGCAGPNVRYDYDVRAGYQAFHTYDWYAPTAAAQARSAGIKNPIVDTRVRRAVEKELGARNFRKETSSDPDFLVTYYPVYRPRGTRRVRMGVGFGFGPLGVGVSGPVGREAIGSIGSIVLEVEEVRTHQIIWKAQADDVLDATDNPEDSEAQVSEAVKKMLSRFPPSRPS